MVHVGTHSMDSEVHEQPPGIFRGTCAHFAGLGFVGGTQIHTPGIPSTHTHSG